MKKMFGGLLMAATILTPLGPAFARPDSPRTHAAERGDRGSRTPSAQRGDNRGETRGQRSRPQYQQGRVNRTQAQRDVRRPAVQTPRRGNDNWQRGDRPRAEQQRRTYDRSRTYDRNRDNRQQWNRDHDRETARRRYDRNRDDNRNWNRNDRHDERRWNRNDNRYRDNRSHNWNRDWRHNQRYDWRNYRKAHRGYYRLPRYYSPYRNRGYTRFSIGVMLGSLYYGQRYWINDPWYYRLPPAYGNYRWVRYYDDALLVDVYSGQVVDVIHDFFW